jgi:pimeloyl-ACP methyl ester carboxylesterase
VKRNRALKVAGITVGTAIGVAGTAYATQRALLRSLRRRPDADPDVLLPLPAGIERRFPSHDGGDLYTLTLGDERYPPIVLMHGVTIDSRVWVKQAHSLPEAGLRTVLFDHRGHGQSVCGDTGHSVENLAADVRTMFESLDLRDAILVGHSMGAVAVQAFAIEHPEVAHDRVRGIVLLSALARTPVTTARWFRKLGDALAGRANLLGSAMRRHDLGTTLARVSFGHEPQPSHVELVREMLAECDGDTIRQAVASLIGLDLTADLPGIDLPTLVIGGTADVLTPPVESRRIAELIPGADLVMVPRAGHTVMLEQAELFDDLVLGFARELGVIDGAARASA